MVRLHTQTVRCNAVGSSANIRLWANKLQNMSVPRVGDGTCFTTGYTSKHLLIRELWVVQMERINLDKF